MRSNIRIASASAVLAITFLPFAARAADPPFINLNLAAANTAPAAGSDLGVSPNPSANTPGQENIRAVPAPTSPPPLTGLFPSAGTTLLDRGIDIHGVLLDHFLANPSAGSRPGNTFNLGVFRPTVDIDLGRLIGLPGGNLHLAETIFLFKGNVPAGATIETGGVLTGYQTTPIVEPNTITTLTYEQKLLGDRLSIEVGKANVHRYFFIPNSIDPFSADSPVLNADADFNSYPYGVWSGRATYHLTPLWYLQAGVFEDNYIRAIRYGYNFGDTGASGVQVLGEIAYRSEFSNERYPANMELGMEWNTRSGPSNQKGTGALYSPRTTAYDYEGGGVLFFQGAKVVWRGAASPNSPPKNIQVYGALNVAVDKPQPFDLDATAGVNFTGFVPRRPSDVFELQARYARLSQIEANFETLSQRRAGSLGTPQSRNGFVLEADYKVQLTPWAAFTPIAQYFASPDNYYVPFIQKNRPHDGFMAGFVATISLGPALGTSRKPF